MHYFKIEDINLNTYVIIFLAPLLLYKYSSCSIINNLNAIKNLKKKMNRVKNSGEIKVQNLFYDVFNFIRQY